MVVERMTMMSNSPLVSYIRISPNKRPRTGKIIGITPHHTACVASVEGLGIEFAKPERQASANYGIGNDGRIGMYVPENYRAWTSNSTKNDNTHITIEVSNCAVGGNWPISDAAWDSLVALCVDICKRNGIEKLTYTGDTTGNLTKHQMFIATDCPGAYLGGRFPELAETVNRILREGEIEMTVEEVTKLIDKRIEEKLTGANSTPDDWAKAEMREAIDLGITDGTRPKGYATRQEAAIMVLRAFKGGAAKAVKDAALALIEKIKGVL